MTDTAHSQHVTDHAFVPKDKWWTVCRTCGLAEAAHRDTTRVTYTPDIDVRR